MLHYIYIIFAEFFRLAQPDALFSQAAPPPRLHGAGCLLFSGLLLPIM